MYIKERGESLALLIHTHSSMASNDFHQENKEER